MPAPTVYCSTYSIYYAALMVQEPCPHVFGSPGWSRCLLRVCSAFEPLRATADSPDNICSEFSEWNVSQLTAATVQLCEHFAFFGGYRSFLVQGCGFRQGLFKKRVGRQSPLGWGSCSENQMSPVSILGCSCPFLLRHAWNEELFGAPCERIWSNSPGLSAFWSHFWPHEDKSSACLGQNCSQWPRRGIPLPARIINGSYRTPENSWPCNFAQGHDNTMQHQLL